MGNRGLYFIIAILVVIVAALAIGYSHERSKTSGIHVETSDHGLTIEHKD